MSISHFSVGKNSAIELLGLSGKLKWKQVGDDLIISIPQKLQGKKFGKYAMKFKISNEVR